MDPLSDYFELENHFIKQAKKCVGLRDPCEAKDRAKRLGVYSAVLYERWEHQGGPKCAFFIG